MIYSSLNNILQGKSNLKFEITVSLFNFFVIIFIFMYFTSPVELFSQQLVQDKDQYTIGEEDKLEIIVHIWGEVNKPGKYKVRDDTNVLELISTAGGPTEYSNLSNVKITRGESGSLEMMNSMTSMQDSEKLKVKQKNFLEKYSKRVIKINLKKYLKNKHFESLPILRPGDTVVISRNKWYTMQTIIRVISQIAIIAQAWYYYSQID